MDGCLLGMKRQVPQGFHPKEERGGEKKRKRNINLALSKQNMTNKTCKIEHPLPPSFPPSIIIVFIT